MVVKQVCSLVLRGCHHQASLLTAYTRLTTDWIMLYLNHKRHKSGVNYNIYFTKLKLAATCGHLGMIHYFLFKLNRLNFWFSLLTWLTSSVFIDIGSLPTSHLVWHLTKGHKPGRSRSSPADHQPPGCSQDEDQYISQLCHGTPWNFRGIPGHPKTTQFLATRWSNTCHVDVFFWWI